MKFVKLVFLFSLLAGSACNSSYIELIENGKTDYSIVLPSNASAEEIRAAEFLNFHLKEISGCELPLAYSDSLPSINYISISKSIEIPGADDYSVSTQNKNIIIKGGSAKGCVYAVSELLEVYLDVRYFSPDYVVIPKKEKIRWPEINFTGSTTNTYRNVHGSFSENQNYKDFHRLHHNNDMFAEGYYVHTFNKLVPWRVYFEPHPEYFAMKNGKRIIDQLCLTNPTVLKLVIEKLKAEMALQPNKKVWSVSQDDNPSYCECADCKKIIEEEQSPAGPVIRFVNQVAEQFPDKTISTLAYIYSRKAPVKTKPADNVQVMLCTIECNRSKPIETDSTSRSFVKDIEDWGKLTQNIYLWDYTVDFAHSISPFPNLHTLQPNIQFFVKNNVHQHFQQTNTGVGHEFSELKSYLLAKLLWNPNSNVDKIIEEFTDGFYGKAAPFIRNYIYLLQEEVVKSGKWLDIYGPPTDYQNSFLSETNLRQYTQFFDEAEKAVANDSVFLKHVRTARMPLQYAIMEIGKSDMFGSRGWYTETNGEFVLKPEMKDLPEKFYKASVACNSAPVNEGGLTPLEYFEATKRFIDVQVKGNFAFRKKVTATPLPASKYSGGDLAYLTNGVRGANDYKVHWIGWEAQNFSLLLDLEAEVAPTTVEISTLWDAKSWILHAKSITCSVSGDGKTYQKIGTQTNNGTQQQEPINKLNTFNVKGKKFRYIKFEVIGTLSLPKWHHAAGGGSWVFVDEVVVR